MAANRRSSAGPEKLGKLGRSARPGRARSTVGSFRSTARSPRADKAGLGVTGRTFLEEEKRNVSTPMSVILGKQHGLGTGFVALKSSLVPPTSRAAQPVATKITTHMTMNQWGAKNCFSVLCAFTPPSLCKIHKRYIALPSTPNHQPRQKYGIPQPDPEDA